MTIKLSITQFGEPCRTIKELLDALNDCLGISIEGDGDLSQLELGEHEECPKFPELVKAINRGEVVVIGNVDYNESEVLDRFKLNYLEGFN